MRVVKKALKIKAKKETPSGTVNGSNVTFTTTFSPLSTDYVSLWLDGLEEHAFTLSGGTITMTTAPATGQSIYVKYDYEG